MSFASSGREVLDSGPTESLDYAIESDGDPLDWAEVFPYDLVEPANITEIANYTTRRCDEIVEQIIGSTAHTYENVLAPINEIHDTIFLAWGYLCQWLVSTDERVRTAAREAEVELTRYFSDLFFNEDFYEKFEIFSETYEGRHLPEEKRELARTVDSDFKFSGQKISRVKREQLRELDHALIEYEIAFDHNLLSDDTTVELAEAEVEGLSDRFKEALRRHTQTGNYIVTMDYPTFYPFMRQASSREARSKVSGAFYSRASENAELLDEIISIRQEMAQLLGAKSWAHLSLKNSMAKSVNEIFKFYDDLIEPLTVKAKEEVALMTGMLMRDGYRGPLQEYDIDYYENEVVKAKYGIDHEKIAEYFPLDVVMEGVFDISGQLFNIRFREVDVPTWHPDVQAYVIEDADSGQEVALFYMDLFPREGKYNHACAVSLVSGRQMPDGTYTVHRAV